MPKSTSKNWDKFRMGSLDREFSTTVAASIEVVRPSAGMRGKHLPLFVRIGDKSWNGVKIVEKERRSSVKLALSAPKACSFNDAV